MLQSVATRFDILRQRYERFMCIAGEGYNAWVDAVKAEKAEEGTSSSQEVSVTLECLTKAVMKFPRQEDEPKEEENWSFTIACMAMRRFIETHVPSARISACGKAVWFEDIQHITAASEPKHPQPPHQDIAYLSMRNAVLEVRVLELESQLKGTMTHSAWTIPTSETDIHAFLMEKRCEAEDALQKLKEERQRHREERRAQGKQARKGAAEDEIARLHAEIELLRASMVRTGAKAPTEDLTPILPRRALTMAGFRNMLPNDVLTITPIMVEAFEREVGPAIHQPNVHVCFPAKDKDCLLKIVARLMEIHLPHILCTK